MGSKAPSPPDPYAVANAQTGTNIATARAQQQLGMTGVEGPTGSTNYVIDPSSPSGYRQVNTLSPEEQALLQQSQGNQAAIGGNLGTAEGQIAGHLATPFDLNAGRATQLSDINKTFLDPQWNAQEEEVKNQLANQGIQPGSDEYNIAMTQFNNQKANAYNNMYLGAYTTANNAAVQNYEMPMMVANMIGGGAPGTPSMPTTPTSQPGVAPTDLMSAVNNNYNAQVANASAAMGGLYGLGGAGLGGWAKGGFANPFGSAAGDTMSV